MPILLRWLREGAITLCGLIALISPVVLWTAWSTSVFCAVLAIGCGAILTGLPADQPRPRGWLVGGGVAAGSPGAPGSHAPPQTSLSGRARYSSIT